MLIPIVAFDWEKEYREVKKNSIKKTLKHFIFCNFKSNVKKIYIYCEWLKSNGYRIKIFTVLSIYLSK